MKRVVIACSFLILVIALSLFVFLYVRAEQTINEIFSYSEVIDVSGDGEIYYVRGDYSVFVEYMTGTGARELPEYQMGALVTFSRDGKLLSYYAESKNFLIFSQKDGE